MANFLAKQNPLFAEDDDVDAVTQFGQQVAITQRKAGQAEVQAINDLYDSIDSDHGHQVSKIEFMEFLRQHKPAHGPFSSVAKLQTIFGLNKKAYITREAFHEAFENQKASALRDATGFSVDIFPHSAVIANRKEGVRTRYISDRMAGLKANLEGAPSIAGDAEGLKEIEGLLANVYSQDPNFHELRLVNNKYMILLAEDEREVIYDKFIVGLAKSKTITDIIINNCGLTDKVGVQFARLLRTNTTIEELTLEQCDIRETGMAEFAAALGETKTLLELRLQHQFKPNIPTPTIIAFVEAVERNGVTTMCSINQRDKSLKVRFNKALAANKESARLAVHTEWVKAGRPGEQFNAVQTEINGLPTSTAAKLSYRDNPMFEAMPKHWINEIFPEKLGANNSVTFLDLAGLELTDTFAKAFADHVLTPDTALERINLSRNSISGAGLVAIANKMGLTGLHRIKLTTQKKGFTTLLITSQAERQLVEACRISETLSTCNVDWRNKSSMKTAETELMTNIRESRFKKMQGV